MPVHQPFRDAVREYAENVRQDYAQNIDAQPEDQLKHHVSGLIRSAGASLPRDIRWRSETRADDVQGRPDPGITVGGLLTGHIELKKPGLGSRTKRFSDSNSDLFECVLVSDLFKADEPPKPTEGQRRPPVVDPDTEMEQSSVELE